VGRIAVIVGTKGRGSNLLALAEALPGQIGLVVTPDASAPAVRAAYQVGLPIAAIPYNESFGANLLTAVKLARVNLICLAGFLRLLPAELLNQIPVLNIHPSLLPKFGGKGMYGQHVHEAVLLAGETETGCTVHRVSEVYDEGEIILQRRCPVVPGDTPATLAERVLAEEHLAYPEAVRLVLARNH